MLIEPSDQTLLALARIDESNEGKQFRSYLESNLSLFTETVINSDCDAPVLRGAARALRELSQAIRQARQELKRRRESGAQDRVSPEDPHWDRDQSAKSHYLASPKQE